jgi:hypothetical protein
VIYTARPDGSYLIFVRVRNKDIKSAVFRMRPGLHQAQFPANKSAIGDIWTISPDGHGRQQVSHSSLFEYRPDWGV